VPRTPEETHAAAEIAGASPEQEALLREVLSRLTGRIRALRVEPYEQDWTELASLGIERGDPSHAREGVSLVLPGKTEPDLRTGWELLLLARAFRTLSAERGLPQVRWVQMPDSGHTIEWDSERKRTYERPQEERVVYAAAATGAIVDRLESLEPHESACAVALALAEPHAFFRHGLGAFCRLADLHDPYFLEVVDGESEPAWTRACAGACTTSSRADVTCCAPFGCISRAIYDPGLPPCPVTARTTDDMLAALRRNVAVRTGYSLDEWYELIPDDAVDSALRAHWLQTEGDVGKATAWAIATARD
jgi:hypothetical protein